MAPDVLRVPGDAPGRCSAVRANGLAFVVANDPDCFPEIRQQTAGCLRELERLLVDVGSGKDRILQATVYLADVLDKPKLDAEWVPWIGPEENWPQRACMGAALDPGYLVEIVVIADAA